MRADIVADGARERGFVTFVVRTNATDEVVLSSLETVVCSRCADDCIYIGGFSAAGARAIPKTIGMLVASPRIRSWCRLVLGLSCNVLDRGVVFVVDVDGI